MLKEQALHNIFQLQLALKNPNLEDVYQEGAECSDSYLDLSFNPYEKDSVEYQYWQEGWMSAAFNETPAFGLETFETALQEETVATEPAAPQASWLKRTLEISCVILATFAIFWAYDYAS